MPFKDPEKKKLYSKEYNEKNKDKIWKRRKNDPAYQAYTKAYMKNYMPLYTKEYEKNSQKKI